MMFNLSLLLAALIAPTLTMSKLVMEIVSESPAQVACEEEDALIRSTISQALMGKAQNRRSLDDFDKPFNQWTVWDWIDRCEPGRCPDDLGWYCFWNCRHLAPGQCWWFEPQCDDVRRALSQEAELPFDDVTYEEVDDASCVETSMVIEAKMEELAEVVESETCRAALMDDKKQYKCYKMVDFE